ncbi:Hypothetical protein A7982_09017 [Minicystis rosea]|nr:Hypothetical protein A7982_09017 [Minicystis rosea]
MTAILHATFHRVAGERDRVEVRRSDGTEIAWRFPTYGGTLPHDLVHLVVESGFGLCHAFWGRVDAGLDPAAINEAAHRHGGADRYRGFGEDQHELLFAEGLAAVCWTDPDLHDLALCDAIVESCAGFGITDPPRVTPDRVAMVRAAVVHLRARWRRCTLPRSLSVSFWADDPEAGLAPLLP